MKRRTHKRRTIVTSSTEQTPDIIHSQAGGLGSRQGKIMATSRMQSSSIASKGNEDLHNKFPDEFAKYKHTLASILRRQHAEKELFHAKGGGKITDEELDAYMMKMLESRKGYLFKKLKVILDKRDPAEAELIRNQYERLAKEIEAE